MGIKLFCLTFLFLFTFNPLIASPEQLNLQRTPSTGYGMAWERRAEVQVAQHVHQALSFEKELLEARTISNELMNTVRGLLMQEIQKGGLTGAVRVCSELAQEMTNRFSNRTGHYLRRVSLRYRNPKNLPDAYETNMLKELDRLNREKKLPDEYVEVVEEGGAKFLRYLKPLTVASLCLTCHGPRENIPQEVQTILRERYPDDRATGFLVGDFRGAISVKIHLSERKP